MRKLATRALQRGIGSMDFVQSLLLMEDEVQDGGESAGPSHHSGNLSIALDSQSPRPHGVSVVDAMKCPELSKTNVANAKNVLPAKEGFKKFV